jgi:mannose-6-phosphate isomerase class I
MVDHGLTKGVILLPTTDTADSKDIAVLLHTHLFKRFGLPDKIISDRNPRFASKAFQELLKLLGIQSAMSTAYHPQTNRATELVNQEVKAYLAIYCAQFPEDWPLALPTLEFVHNSRRHANNKKSPFELIMGLQPLAMPLGFQETSFPSITERFRLLQQYQNKALTAHKIACNRISQRLNAHYTPFRIGQQVWLDTQNLQMKINSKLKPHKEGPFTITDVIGKVNYKLALPSHWKIHPVFHAVLLKPYKETEQHRPNFIGPPPDIVNDEEQYKVERIINHRKRRRSMQYLI